MAKRPVPHVHYCSVCNDYIGCADDRCQLGMYSVCEREICQERFDSATVHWSEGAGSIRLRCCSLLPSETARGDRATLDKNQVTCPAMGAAVEGRARAAAASSVVNRSAFAPGEQFRPEGEGGVEPYNPSDVEAAAGLQPGQLGQVAEAYDLEPPPPPQRPRGVPARPAPNRNRTKQPPQLA